MKYKVYRLISILFIPCSVLGQQTYSYGSEFPEYPFINVSNGQKIVLPEHKKATLFYFSYENNYNGAGITYLETLQNAYSEKFHIFHIIDHEIDVSSKNSITTLQPLNKNAFVFDFYTQKIFLLVDEYDTVRYVGSTGSFKKFSRILQSETSYFKTFDQTRLEKFFKNLQLKKEVEINAEKGTLLIMIRSICLNCRSRKKLIYFLHYLSSYRNNLNIVILVRNTQVKRELEKIDKKNVLGNKIILPITKFNDRLFLKGNPVIFSYNENSQFINLKMGNNFSDHDLKSYLNQTFY